MARYIKAVECAEIISKKLNIPLGDLVDIFAEIPTADVVPKSEFERVYYNLQTVLEERVETKQEIAREIFDEIEKVTFSFGYGVRSDHTVAHTRSIDDDLLAELKKKYTEGEQRND